MSTGQPAPPATALAAWRAPLRLKVRKLGRADDEVRIALGEVLRDAELSAAELSRRAGVDHRTAARWLSGRQTVSVDRAVALVEAVGGRVVLPRNGAHLRAERHRDLQLSGAPQEGRP